MLHQIIGDDRVEKSVPPEALEPAATYPDPLLARAVKKVPFRVKWIPSVAVARPPSP
jgi:hypothetical protein